MFVILGRTKANKKPRLRADDSEHLFKRWNTNHFKYLCRLHRINKIEQLKFSFICPRVKNSAYPEDSVIKSYKPKLKIMQIISKIC